MTREEQYKRRVRNLRINVLQDLSVCLADIEKAVLLTPTGEERNKYTDVQIYIGEALAVLRTIL